MYLVDHYQSHRWFFLIQIWKIYCHSTIFWFLSDNRRVDMFYFLNEIFEDIHLKFSHYCVKLIDVKTYSWIAQCSHVLANLTFILMKMTKIINNLFIALSIDRNSCFVWMSKGNWTNGVIKSKTPTNCPLFECEAFFQLFKNLFRRKL